MITQKNSNFLPGLKISQLKADNCDLSGIFPLIAEEFPSWGISKLRDYLNKVFKNESSGLLVAQNETFYNVGLLIYTIQNVCAEKFGNLEDDFSKCLVIENLIASSPILEKSVFLSLVEKAVDIAENNSCRSIELPKFDSSFDLIKKKYKNKILNLNGWRTFLEIDKVLTANKEL